MHSSLFADAMTALGLDPAYGAYLDCLPAVTLATTNLISMFGLHRHLRGALVGHLASFQTNLVGPMARYSAWLESLGVPESGRRFYDVHVEADEEHQHIAVNDLVGGLLEVEPAQAGAVLFGARSVELVERIFADHVVSAWRNKRTPCGRHDWLDHEKAPATPTIFRGWRQWRDQRERSGKSTNESSHLASEASVSVDSVPDPSDPGTH